MAYAQGVVEQPRAAEEEVRLLAARDEAYAAAEAGHAVPGPGAQPWLLAGLPAQEAFLQAAVRYFRDSSAHAALSYAAEWMLDNFYLAEQTLRQIREDMPRHYYNELPKLTAGLFPGYPRIYEIAQRLVFGSGAQLDLSQVTYFVSLYQDVMPLTTGELWALPVMLRLAVLDALARALTQVTGLPRQVELPAIAFPEGLTGDEIVGNCFTSLRTLDTQDWKQFFESVSRVEAVLRHDPAGVYSKMERETRDQYRKVVEELALGAGQNEQAVAQAAVDLARAAAEGMGLALSGTAVDVPGPDTPLIEAAPRTMMGDNGREPATEPQTVEAPRDAHVGYYLLDDGRRVLEREVGYRPGPSARLGRWALAHPSAVYLGPIILLALAVVAVAVIYALGHGAAPAMGALVLLLSVIPALTASVALMDWIVTLAVRPRILPKLDLSTGIPEPYRTLVAVPALLTSAGEIQSLVSQLEQHFLRNPERNLYFALLTDFADAPEQHLSEDEALLQSVRTGLAALNARYAGLEGDKFYLFHRERRWNEREGRWMGWERKRGKLHELNCWLQGERDTSFVEQPGGESGLRGVRYVITLDADTILGTAGARRLVGTLAHPLNHAEWDPRTGQVVRGYGLLQPRTENTAASANFSHFSRIFAGDIGLDLYTRAVSNVYQDLFGSGIYIGKGIYDVAAFERSLAGRVPENALLSHDLFEGIHGRVGLVTDIVLYEDYPPNYLAYMGRLHRWMRGDWQLLPWLRPWVPGEGEREVRSSFNVIDLWKLLDNLRRSLVPLALLLLLAAGWLVLPGAAWAWTIFAVLALAVPALIGSVTPFVTGPASAPWRRAARSLLDSGLRWLLALVFLPFEAAQSAGAIATSLARVVVTRRGLLQWTTAAEAARRESSAQAPLQTVERMPSSIAVPVALGLLLLIFSPANLLLAAPLLLAWAAGPVIAYWINLPLRHAPPPLSAEERTVLRSLARRTWLFFEHYAGPEEHWLPPDHFQEAPRGIVAPYTSPTNIGLLLLSTLSAFDLGYIGLPVLVTRLQNTFDTLARLERYRGHFLNWYDTRTLEPLLPRYVSTVDSGNLAACFSILGQACQALPHGPVMRWQRWEGLADTLTLLDDFIRDLEQAEEIPAAGQVREAAAELRERLLSVQAEQEAWLPALEYVAEAGWPRLADLLAGLIEEHSRVVGAETLARLRIASDRMSHQLFTLHRYLVLLVPWLFSLQASRRPVLFAGADLPDRLAKPYRELLEVLSANPSLAEEPELCQAARIVLAQLQGQLRGLGSGPEVAEALAWCDELRDRLAATQTLSRDLLAGLAQIGAQAEAYFDELDLHFLFEPQRQVFHIGYNVTAGKIDNNYYDLLESEARIASLIALAKHQVPATHWLHLARPLTQVNGTRALLSWSATMFEYLMPTLFMRSYEGTLLHESSLAAIDLQIDYARRKGVPWGISESGYYAFDPNQNYQYRAFGVPGLGFKRNLAEDLVVTPYASILALPYRPQAVAGNIPHLAKLGGLGVHGLYEAIDFTPARLPAGQEHAVVREYMAHHQGMILVALANYLSDSLMVQRLHSDPRLASVELLLQERLPTDAPLEFPQPGDLAPMRRAEPPVMTLPWSVPVVGTPLPQVHYLSNGSYGVLITSGGGGVSRWGDMDLTRWRADSTLDDWGQWLYVQDRTSGDLWSAAYQPAGTAPAEHGVLYHAHMADFQRTDHGITLTMHVAVAPDDDVEIRRVTLLNHSETPRRLALTSCGEVVMAPHEADLRHPAFNKLFIESEYLEDPGLLLFWRRPRSEKESPVFLAHLAVSPRGGRAARSFEGDRARFLGRNHTYRAPAALADPQNDLSCTVGATLDPIMALQCEVDLQPGESAELAFITLAAAERSRLIETAERYTSWLAIEHAFAQARSRAELELRQLGLSTMELERNQQLLSALLYSSAGLRADPAVLAANAKGQPGLWTYAISGDYPILLVRVSDEDDLGFVHDILQAHLYWRKRLLKIDLVIYNEREASYSQGLRDQLHRLLRRLHSETWMNQRGGIFLVNATTMPESDRVLVQTAARVVLDAHAGNLAGQLEALRRQPAFLPPFTPERPDLAGTQGPTAPVARPSGRLFDNGPGGFARSEEGAADGQEYQIYLDGPVAAASPGQLESTPAPWVNVIANPDFGFLVSETGSGYSWSLNSGENRLTPWSNDPVRDPAGEALYLRDEETAELWSPTPGPCGAAAPYLVRHGSGYTVFEHHSHGLEQRLRLYTPPDAPVKIVHLRIDNVIERPRRITATFYAEWVLGVSRENMAQYVVPDYDHESQALLARNAYNAEFGEQVAFVAASKHLHGLTADRTEFLGRMGDRSRPAGLQRIGLSGTVRAGLDPCAALQVHLDLQPGESEEVWFVLGQAASRAEAVHLAAAYKDAERAEVAWQAAHGYWHELLSTVQVRTPDPAMDVLLNRWLLYQALSCRVWGRSAFYQSSGAFGFRDQLQDVMAAIHAAPQTARSQILRAAAHQFEAGDVLHWWHPPSGRGVRTHCSDDMLWLPFVTAHYVVATEDWSILSEKVPLLRAAPLAPVEEDRYGQYPATPEEYTLYEHCRRAIERGSTRGPHGLPLIGTGDWNDGLNRVGVEGRGESVWLGWFLHATLTHFAAISEHEGEADEAEAYRARAARLAEALEKNAWDGAWYLRAFYDDGTPLGGAQDLECQIDAIAQSWAVLSGAGEPGRAAQAMGAVIRRLVRPEDRLVLLFTPPFDKTPRDPGYIKGYLPGIRENGGQYTHAALWTTWAFAELGQEDTAASLFKLLNPIYHSDTPDKIARYQVEPYVVAADVYSVTPHTGRGGWTWYTGSAAWMYRLGLEGILGIKRRGAALRIEPHVPREWPGYEVSYRYGSATYHMSVHNGAGGDAAGRQISVDGQAVEGAEIALVDDGRVHEVVVQTGRKG